MRQYIWKCFKTVKCCAGSFPAPHPHTNCCGSGWRWCGGDCFFGMLFDTISTCKNSNVGRDHFFPQSSLPAAKIICYVNGNISTVVCGTWWWLQINSLTINLPNYQLQETIRYISFTRVEKVCKEPFHQQKAGPGHTPAEIEKAVKCV